MKQKSKHRLLDRICLIYTCRWAFWLAAFLPPVRQAWGELTALPGTGVQLQRLAQQIGSHPAWRLVWDQVLGLPGSCVLLAILFLRYAVPLVQLPLGRLLQWGKNGSSWLTSIASQPVCRTCSRYYLRWIDQQHGELLYDLQEGSPADDSGHLLRTILPEGDLVFDPDDKSVVLNAGGLQWAKLTPHESMVLPLEQGQKSVLIIYAAIQTTLPIERRHHHA